MKKISLDEKDIDDSGRNATFEVVLPSGEILTIMAPLWHPFNDYHGSHNCSLEGETYGLNFVTDGHHI